MACPGIPCSQTPAPPSWTFSSNPHANRFCDDRLVGLAESDAAQGTTLVAVDPVTGCLSQPAAPKGVWQHDPDRCLPDFVGPLDDPEFINIGDLDPAKAHTLPVMERDCQSGIWKLVKLAPTQTNLGLPMMLREECCADSSTYRVMAPEFLLNGRQNAAGSCVSPRVLGYVPYERQVCDGKAVTEYKWFSLDKWQQDDAPAVVESDILDAEEGETQNIWLAAWRTETCPAGGSVKQLVKMTGPRARDLLGIADSMVPEPVLIYQQYTLVNSAITHPGITYYPSLPSPGGSILSQPISYDLNTIPQYKPDIHTGVILSIQLIAGTISQSFDTVVEFGGYEYARTSVIGLSGEWASDTNYNQPIVRIPDNGVLTGNYYYQISTPGAAAGVIARVYVVGFV